MEAFKKMALLADLEGVRCSLNHGPGIEPPEAVNYIIQYLGEENACKSEVALSICKECCDALQGDEWTLLFCLECSESQWVCRELARKHYRHHIIWSKGCPKCGNEFKGLYFTE